MIIKVSIVINTDSQDYDLLVDFDNSIQLSKDQYKSSLSELLQLIDSYDNK